MKTNVRPVKIPKDPFAYIAFWQLLTFIALILMVWINELRDGATLVFDASPSEVNLFRAFLLTAAILVAAIVTIGNTYLQQQRVVKDLVSVCSNCHRVRLNSTVWQKMEEYIGERSLLSFTHGLCPECSSELMKTIELKGTQAGKKQ
jgi:cytochrome c553